MRRTGFSRHRIWYFGLLLLWLASSSFGQSGEPSRGPVASLTLEAAVELALQQNPMIRMTAAGRDLAGARLSEAKAARLPALSFRERYTHSNNPVFVFGSLLEQGRFSEGNFAIDSLNNPASLSNFRSALNLRIPVFNRLQLDSRVKQAHLGEEEARVQHLFAQQQIRYEVIRAYYAILVAEARREVAAQAVETAQAEVQRIRDLVDQGIVVTSDLLAMEVQLAEFEQQRIQAEGDVATAYAALKTVLGRPDDPLLNIAERLEERDFPALSQAQLGNQALESRPDLQGVRQRAERERLNVRAARGRYLPDLNMFAEFGHSGQTLAQGSADFSVGAELTFEVLDFARSSRVRQARSALESAQAELEQKANQVQLDVVEAYQGFVSAQARLKVAAKAVRQAEETLRIVRDRHQVGLTTVTEVLRSQTTQLRAQMSLLSARYAYYVGYARVLLVSGQLENVAPFTS